MSFGVLYSSQFTIEKTSKKFNLRVKKCFFHVREGGKQEIGGMQTQILHKLGLTW